jgi:hypothetical protein
MMSMRNSLIFLLIVCANLQLKAQLEGLYIETYYVSDSLDATNTFGGELEAGETTYRVYIDLAPGSKLVSAFGDADHPFQIASSRRFFNNVDGATFGYNIPKVLYESNTVALDSYITLGQNGFQGSRNFFGVPKENDTDGSFIGGLNNDGGSGFIEGGLLVNADAEAGLPLTEADGMDTLNLVIEDWFNFGVVDFTTGEDSTIFSVNAVDSVFNSTQFSIECSGVYGVNGDTNHVLLAQLTTPGEIDLRLNVRVLTETGDTLTYYGTNIVNQPNTFFAPFLVYPQVCGCTDANYLEFSPDFACDEEGSCQTPIVFGCTDTLACNFDPLANYNIDNLCCYPGFCQERDLEEVCPQLKGETFDFNVYPNPAADNTFIQVISGVSSDLVIEVLDYNGVIVYSESVPVAPLNYSTQIDFSGQHSGIYLVRVTGVEGVKNAMLVKL